MTASLIIAGLSIAGLGFFAKGFLSTVIIYIGSWIAKKGILIWFLNTKFGRGVVRCAQRFAMTRFGRGFGKLVFRIKQKVLAVTRALTRFYESTKARFRFF